MEIHAKQWKQFHGKAPKGLKGGQLYDINFNAKSLPKDVIPVVDTFIARNHQKFIRITIINQSDEPTRIPGGKHIGTVHEVEGRQPSEEEVSEILDEFKPQTHYINSTTTGFTDEFITRGDQVQLRRPIQYGNDPKLPSEMKQALDDIIKEYADIFSKDQYDVGISNHSPVKIPTEGPPCISAPYTIPLKFRPWADNTINKLLDAGIIQRTMSTWASPVISVRGLEIDPKIPKAPLPITTRLRMYCDYRKLKYNKHRQRIVKQGISAPYPLPKIDEMFDTIWGKWYLTTLDCTGAFHSLKLSPDAAKICIHNTSRKIPMAHNPLWTSIITIVLLNGYAEHAERTRKLRQKLHG